MPGAPDTLKSEGLSTSRIEAFSDGVFSIVITLLILEMKLPALSYAQAEVTLLPQLLALGPKLLSYVISFLVIGTYWVAHHNAFQYAERGNRILMWLNMIFLMCLSSIPFPTALLGDYAPLPVAVATYGLTMLVTAIIFNAMWWYIAYGSGLMRSTVNAQTVGMLDVGGIFG
ncbi:TMEM175 family protein [Anthocerotibacter panamensis]|uniref:TMEM175 family protein n=1 Tax=Anthocerotibacter panamensis TaxID=2857077 RepID=UPI001C4017E1|nr:TMEM175 family protein [Anthocerotibacter panamensis]